MYCYVALRKFRQISIRETEKPIPIDTRSHISGCSPLSLLTFFATAAKKVGAAPHRGEANRPIRMQGKANTVGKKPKPPARQKNHFLLAKSTTNPPSSPILTTP